MRCGTCPDGTYFLLKEKSSEELTFEQGGKLK